MTNQPLVPLDQIKTQLNNLSNQISARQKLLDQLIVNDFRDAGLTLRQAQFDGVRLLPGQKHLVALFDQMESLKISTEQLHFQFDSLITQVGKDRASYEEKAGEQKNKFEQSLVNITNEITILQSDAKKIFEGLRDQIRQFQGQIDGLKNDPDLMAVKESIVSLESLTDAFGKPDFDNALNGFERKIKDLENNDKTDKKFSLLIALFKSDLAFWQVHYAQVEAIRTELLSLNKQPSVTRDGVLNNLSMLWTLSMVLKPLDQKSRAILRADWNTAAKSLSNKLSNYLPKNANPIDYIEVNKYDSDWSQIKQPGWAVPTSASSAPPVWFFVALAGVAILAILLPFLVWQSSADNNTQISQLSTVMASQTDQSGLIAGINATVGTVIAGQGAALTAAASTQSGQIAELNTRVSLLESATPPVAKTPPPTNTPFAIDPPVTNESTATPSPTVTHVKVTRTVSPTTTLTDSSTNTPSGTATDTSTSTATVTPTATSSNVPPVETSSATETAMPTIAILVTNTPIPLATTNVAAAPTNTATFTATFAVTAPFSSINVREKSEISSKVIGSLNISDILSIVGTNFIPNAGSDSTPDVATSWVFVIDNRYNVGSKTLLCGWVRNDILKISGPTLATLPVISAPPVCPSNLTITPIPSKTVATQAATNPV